MAYLPLDDLSKLVQTLVEEVLQEAQVVKQGFIGFFPEFSLQLLGQVLQQVVVFVLLELLIDAVLDFDEVGDFGFGAVVDEVLLAHSVQNFELVVLFVLSFLDECDERTDCVDVVGECDAGEGFYENQN